MGILGDIWDGVTGGGGSTAFGVIGAGLNLAGNIYSSHQQSKYMDQQAGLQRQSYLASERAQTEQFGLQLESYRRQNDYSQAYYDWAKNEADKEHAFAMTQYENLQALGAAKAGAIQSSAAAQVKEVQRVARENYKIHMYDAGVARESAFNSRFSFNEALRIKMREDEYLLSKQASAYAGAGVVVDQGTPLDVAQETAKLMTQEMISLKFEGQKEFDYYLDMEDRYRNLANKTLEEAAAAAATIKAVAAANAQLAMFEASILQQPVYKEPAPPQLIELAPYELVYDNMVTRIQQGA